MERPLPGGFDSFGHAGRTLNFTADLVTVPALTLGVFIATNSDSGGALVEALPGQIVDRFYAAAMPPARTAPPDFLRPCAATYAGDYLTEKRRYGGLEQFVDLLGYRMHMDVTPDGRLVAGDQAFVPTGQPGQFREVAAPGRIGAFQFKNDQAVPLARRPSGYDSCERVGWSLRAAHCWRV